MTMSGPSPDVTRPGLTRRGLLAGAGAAAGLALTGCSDVMVSALTGSPMDSTVVKYWNLFGGGDGDRMRQMVADYRASHPDIELRSTTFAWGNPYYTKLSLGTLAEQPPHIAVCHADRMVTPVDTGLLRPFHPDELAEFDLVEENFHPPAWDAVHRDGRMYAIPLDYHPMAVYYNTDLCAAAGLLDGDGRLRPIAGTGAFVDMLRAVQDMTGDFPAAVANEPASQYRFFYTLFSQAGGTLVADEGRTVVLTRDAFMDVAAFIRSLSHELGVLPKNVDSGSAVANFVNQRTAFFLSGGWERPTFVDAGVPFSVRSFPKLFDRHVAWDGTHAFVVPRLDGGSDERVRAALHFIRGMLDRSSVWVEGGHLSTWLPVADQPATARILPHYEDLPADGLAYDPRVWYAGSGSNLQVVIGSAIASLLAGFFTPEQAYTAARDGLEELARTTPPT